MALSKIQTTEMLDAPNLGRRNLIINGAMQVAQRGTSVTGQTAAGYASVDRYNMNLVSLGTWTISQSTTAPTGFTTSTKLDCTTADATAASSSYFLFEQRIEAQNLQHLAYGTSSAKSMTLSFWVRSNKTGTYYTEVQHGDAGSNYFNNHSYTISSANTWEKKIIPVTGQTAAIINNDNGIGMFVRWCIGHDSDATSGTTTNNTWHQTTANRFAGQVNLADSTSNEWYITGIQLEVGDTATDFEHRPFNDVWEECQRYCTVYNVGGGNVHSNNHIGNNAPCPGSGGHIDIGNRCEWFLSYPVKRSNPTITVTDPTHMRWLGPNNAVRDGTGDVTYPVGTGIQRANIFQSVAGDFPTSVSPSAWLHSGGGTYPKITIDAEL